MPIFYLQQFTYHYSQETTSRAMEPRDEIRVWPNPFSATLRISDKLDFNLIQVIDMMGKVLYEESAWTDLLNLTALNAGIYFLRISSDQGECLIKLVKN